MRSCGPECVSVFLSDTVTRRYKMKLSLDSRGWLWTALLLLAASCTVKAANDTTLPTTDPGTSKEGNGTSQVNGTSPAPVESGNATTAAVPAPTSSSKVTSPTPPANTTKAPVVTTPTTQGPAVTSGSTTTVASKAPNQTTSAAATSSSPVTSSISASLQKTSGFDLGSFIGGIVLTVGLLAAVYFGCRFYSSKRGVRYRTIDEHEAII